MTRAWYRALYENFADYDAEPYAQGTVAEVDFIEEVIDRDRTKRILDIGCGTGRHSLELARRGYEVVGIDLSAELLQQAHAKAAAEGVSVLFLERDARELDFHDAFDVALILCEGGFSLVETDDMDRQILRGAASALHSGGRLIMTAPNAAHMIAGGAAGFDLITSREFFELETQNAQAETVRLQCSQRYYLPAELRLLLQTAGFTAVSFFAVTGGYEREQPPRVDHFEFGATARRAGTDEGIDL